jgi:DNA polymerase (family 10)
MTTIDVPFLPEKTEMEIPTTQASTPSLQHSAPPSSTRLPLERARKIADFIVEALRPLCWKIEIAGSIRRQRPDCGDIDLVVIPTNHDALRRRIAQRCSLTSDGRDIIIAKMSNGVQLDVYCARPEERTLLDVTPSNWGSVMVCRTGSKEFNKYLCMAAAHKGLHWDPFRGVLRAGKVIASETEEDVFRALGLTWVCPESRER